MRPSSVDVAGHPPGATFASLAESSSDLVIVASLDGTIAYANPAAERLLAVKEHGAWPASLEEVFDPEDGAYVREVILGTLAREGSWTGDYRLRSPGSAPGHAMRLNVFHVVDSGSNEPVAVAVTGHDVGVQRQTEQRLRTLIESGPALSNSLDYAQTLQNLAELVVRTLATFCEVDVFARVPGFAARIERVAAYHVEAIRRSDVERLSAYVPSLENVEHPVVRVLMDGASSLVDIDAGWLGRATTSPEHADALRGLGASALVTVPLVANGKTLGALSCYIADEPPGRSTRPTAYDAEDLFFLEELGRRAGSAIDNALSFEHERAIAASLQAASLPAVLPNSPGVQIDADYRPGSSEATIGGDWYDAFVLEDGNFVFTIGDVVGNGLRAGIAMTKLRASMQAAAMVDSDPNVMLAVADRTMRLHDPDGFATALAARYDPKAKALTFASAGHPGPLLRYRDGRVDDLTSSGILIGMRRGESSATSVIAVPAGATLVFYTDGLIEATRDMAEGQARLLEAVARLSPSPNPARIILNEVLRGAPAGDDIAVLVIAFDHEPPANKR